MPEMPEVQGLVDFLTTRTTGQTVARAAVSAISALKTFDPPLSTLAGGEVSEVRRHDKFVDLALRTSGDPVHLIFHLAKAGRTTGNEITVRALGRLRASTCSGVGENPNRR